jgi:hypothetical protein
MTEERSQEKTETGINADVKFIEALVKVQAELRPAIKDSTNPHFGAKYADLQSVWDAAREPLIKNGFCVVQTTEPSGDGKWLVRTKLAHVSGKSFEFDMPLLMNKSDMQALGSAITYARRYSLSMVIGIAPAEDDGNLAAGKLEESQKSPSPTQPNPIPLHVRELFGRAAKLGCDEYVLRAKVKQLFPQIKNRKELTPAQCKFLLENLTNTPPEAAKPTLPTTQKDGPGQGNPRAQNAASRESERVGTGVPEDGWKKLPATEKQIARLYAIGKNYGAGHQELKELAYDIFKKEHLQELTMEEVQILFEEFEVSGKTEKPMV